MALRKGKCLLPDLRSKAGNMTQAELVDRLKPYGIRITPQSISKYERNLNPMDDLVRKACAIIFDCTMDDLYEYFW